MTWKTIWIAVAVAAIISVCGCRRDAPQEAEMDEPVRTAEEFRTEAQEQITQENLEAELERLEREVEADLGLEE